MAEELFALQATGTESIAALRQSAAERVARHRSRRAVQARQEAQTLAERRDEVRNAARHGVSRVRDTVAARYENSPSYREYLAAEAERALQQAQAEAEVAARKARAVAEAQMQLLEELEQWTETGRSPREQALDHVRAEARGELAHALADIALGARELIREPALAAGPDAGGEPAVQHPLHLVESAPELPLTEISSGGLTVRLYDGFDRAEPAFSDLKPNRQRAAHAAPEELYELDEELERRHGAEPVPPHVVETTTIPANLIEFPRELIASRRVRPRIAEGPLREDLASEPQLRIFEVEAEQIAIEPLPSEPTGSPEWQGLLLDSPPADSYVVPAEAASQYTVPLQVASLGRRLFAAGVDAACLLAAAAGFAEAALHLGTETLRHAPLPLLGMALGVTLLAFGTIYQMLFFTLSESTPGMRAARIALCTFGDDNPSRKAMRRRVIATLLAACPLGVGLLWSFLDDERLGWHDRISRMYQRAY